MQLQTIYIKDSTSLTLSNRKSSQLFFFGDSYCSPATTLLKTLWYVTSSCIASVYCGCFHQSSFLQQQKVSDEMFLFPYFLGRCPTNQFCEMDPQGLESNIVWNITQGEINVFKPISVPILSK